MSRADGVEVAAVTEQPPSGRIFLSYRRTDAQHIAGRLFDRLKTRFGVENVFMDVDSIEPGMDYGEVIDAAVGSCDVPLAVIGRGWLGAVDECDRRRLDDPDDLIVLEIATALTRHIRVIPVLIDGAAPPRRDDLPEVLAPLARRQAIRLDHASFNATMATLLTALERALANTTTASAPGIQDVVHEDHRTSHRPSPQRRAREDWTTEDFDLLLRDRRPSARRIATVLDELARQPDVEVPLSTLAQAVGASRSQLRGAFAGLTFLCKQLRPGIEYDWPIIWREGVSTQPGQTSETWYHIPASVANQWRRTRARQNDSPSEAPQ
jgi:AraC-like DNA-binding protein